MPITRRFAIAALATVTAAFASVSLIKPATAEDLVLRFSTAGPPPDFLARSMESFATQIADADIGVSVEVYPASTLVRQGAEVPAIQRGNLEMSTMTTFEVAAQVPELGFLNRAFLFRDYDHMMDVMSGPVGEAVVEKVRDVMDIEILSVAYLGTRTLNLREARDVTSPDDLEGVQLRMPATPEWLLLGESLGVSPTPMPMSEVYVALQTGAVDGQENPLTITRAARFNEVTEQVVLTAHLVQPVFYAIGLQAWEQMTPEQQEVVRAAAIAAAEENNTGRFADEQDVVAQLNADGMRVDEPDLAAFRARADAIYAEAELARDWDMDLMGQAIK